MEGARADLKLGGGVERTAQANSCHQSLLRMWPVSRAPASHSLLDERQALGRRGRMCK